jgi:hypothetical protein
MSDGCAKRLMGGDGVECVCGGGSWSGALQLAVVGASSMTTAGCLEGARAHPMGRGSVGNGSVPASRAGSPCSVDPGDAIHNQALPLS